jgi:hypothetical protein
MGPERVGRECYPQQHEQRGYVVEHLGEDGAVLVVYETGELKKGTTTSQPWPEAPRRSRPSTPPISMSAPTPGRARTCRYRRQAA